MFEALPMTQDDAAELERMMTSEVPDYLAHFSAFRIPGQLQKQAAAAKRDAFFSIFHDGRLSGFYCIRGLDMGFERPSFGVYVASFASGAGLARSALETSIAWCRGRSIPNLMLKVSPVNMAAHRLYREAGFVSLGRCPDTGHTMMEKSID